MLLILIPCVINIIEAVILHNCNESDQCPFKMIGLAWLLWGIIALSPIINIISAVVVGIIMSVNFANDNLVLRPSNHWLFKKY